MKKITLSLLSVFFIQGLILAQSVMSTGLAARLSETRPESSAELIWVFFKDKGALKEGTAYKAAAFLSERALKRREKVSGSRDTDFTDIPVNREYITQIEKQGLIIKQKSKWLNAVSVIAGAGKIRELALLPFVKQLDIVGRGLAVKVPQLKEQISFGVTPKTLAHKYNYGSSLTQMERENVPAAHDLGYSGKGVIIAVMDAGVDNINHPAFDSLNKRSQIMAMYDFVNKRQYIGDGQGGQGEGKHGTATLSVIGGFKEGTLIGPAFDAQYILAKTENTASETPAEEDNWIAAMEWADSIGVDVTSTSLGYNDFDRPYTSYTWQNMDGKTARITRAACLAVKKGIIVVNSAGNDYDNLNHNTLGAPADGDSVITVGAVNPNGSRSDFSSVGPTADGRIKPDIMAQGTSITAAGYSTTPNGFTTSITGTSFSCPIAAGVAALILQANTDLTPVQVRDAMRNTASKAGTPDKYFGWGIIDAVAAIKSVMKKSDSVDISDLPGGFILSNNFPNPFNGITNFKFSVKEKALITLRIYNTLGQEVAKVFSSEYDKGMNYIVRWDTGQLYLPSGVYIARLSSPSHSLSQKIMLLK